jgi:hypothetical protein
MTCRNRPRTDHFVKYKTKTLRRKKQLKTSGAKRSTQSRLKMDPALMTEEERDHVILEVRTQQARDTLREKIPVDAPERAYRFTEEIKNILETIEVLNDDKETLIETQKDLMHISRQKVSQLNERSRTTKRSSEAKTSSCEISTDHYSRRY